MILPMRLSRKSYVAAGILCFLAHRKIPADSGVENLGKPYVDRPRERKDHLLCSVSSPIWTLPILSIMQEMSLASIGKWKLNIPNLGWRTLTLGLQRFASGNLLAHNSVRFYNRTEYSGLETHILNSYTNAIVQVMHYLLPIRRLAKSHIATDCPREHCLLCELGFVARMLEDAKGINCQASNFCKTVGVLAQGEFLPHSE